MDGRQHICDVRDATGTRRSSTTWSRRSAGSTCSSTTPASRRAAPIETLSEESWDLNLDVNLKGTFLMCQAVIPAMKRQRSGRIINAASFAAILPITGSGAYAASKAGVHYFTRALAGELGPWNITVNCYAPGMIPTEINRFTRLPQERQRRLLDTLTFRRWGEAREVANLICFLASDLAGYITGTMIDVSGGSWRPRSRGSRGRRPPPRASSRSTESRVGTRRPSDDTKL